MRWFLGAFAFVAMLALCDAKVVAWLLGSAALIVWLYGRRA